MKILISAGTRPEVIKIMPIIMELKKRNINIFFLYTGQHRDLAKPLFDFFNIYPDIDLDIMKENQSISYITASILTKTEKILMEEKPDIVLVHGDTSTTFVSALASFYQKIPVAHIEAGLRTHNIYSPFPEELNRTLVSKIATYHFAPTETNFNNLINDGVNKDSIIITGNTVIDAVKHVASSLQASKSKKILVTTHRRENLGSPMKNICKAVKEIANIYNDYTVTIPMHPNPKVRKIIKSILENVKNVNLIEPLDYVDFIKEMISSKIILTDSGGIQEEAPAFDIPVVVLREETERTEGVKSGTLIMAGTNQENIFKITKKLITDKEYYNKIASAENPYGEGNSSKQIVDFLIDKLGDK